MLALPTLLLAIAIVAILGPSLRNTMVAVTIVRCRASCASPAPRCASELPKDYVTASRMAGVGRLRLMFSPCCRTASRR